jgi:hypothetical protein
MRVLQEGNGDVSGLLWIPKVHWPCPSLVHILLYNMFVADHFVHLAVYSKPPVAY